MRGVATLRKKEHGMRGEEGAGEARGGGGSGDGCGSIVVVVEW